MQNEDEAYDNPLSEVYRFRGKSIADCTKQELAEEILRLNRRRKDDRDKLLAGLREIHRIVEVTLGWE